MRVQNGRKLIGIFLGGMAANRLFFILSTTVVQVYLVTRICPKETKNNKHGHSKKHINNLSPLQFKSKAILNALRTYWMNPIYRN